MADATAHGRCCHDHAPELDRGTVIAGGWRDKSPNADQQRRLIIAWTAKLALS